jgi:hypothetical protein
LQFLEEVNMGRIAKVTIEGQLKATNEGKSVAATRRATSGW